MILTEQEISEILSFPWEKTVDFVRRVEARIEEKLKAQTPVGSVYRNVVTGDFELLAYDDANHPKGTYSDIYTDPLPPADVVRDAERIGGCVAKAMVATQYVNGTTVRVITLDVLLRLKHWTQPSTPL